MQRTQSQRGLGRRELLSSALLALLLGEPHEDVLPSCVMDTKQQCVLLPLRQHQQGHIPVSHHM